MAHCQIEYVNVRALPFRSLGRGDIAATGPVYRKMNYGMFDQDFLQINFLMQYRENLQAQRQFVHLEKRSFVGLLQSVNDDSISFGGQLSPVEVITANLHRSTRCCVSFLHNLRQNVAMETFASHHKNSSDDRAHS